MYSAHCEYTRSCEAYSEYAFVCNNDRGCCAIREKFVNGEIKEFKM
jgi:hypothetical protein